MAIYHPYFNVSQGIDEALTEIQSLQDVNQKDEDGWTALMYAARLGQIEMANAYALKDWETAQKELERKGVGTG